MDALCAADVAGAFTLNSRTPDPPVQMIRVSMKSFFIV